MATFNRERAPERVVHAKGSGAFGTLTITNDITKYSKARVFPQVGEKTPALARFSTVAEERGAADAERDVGGFALKFYTEEGSAAPFPQRKLSAGNNTAYGLKPPQPYN